jgi:HK97 family phage major capsid protein
MTMTMAEGRTECKRLYDECAEILKKYGGKITDDTPNDERKKITDNLAEINGLEIKMGGWKRDEEDTTKIADGVVSYGAPAENHRQPGTPTEQRSERRPGLGARFVRDDGYRALLDRRAWNEPQPKIAYAMALGDDESMLREIKALVTGGSDTSGGAFVIADRQAYLPQLYAPLTFLDLLPVVSTSSDLVEWVTGAFTNAAAPTAEATATTGTSGTKPESAIAFAVVSQAVQAINHWIPVTTRAMADAPQLRGIIEGELLAGLRRVLESQCVSGTGTSPQLQGLMTIAGTQTTASIAPHAEAFFTAQMLVRTNGFVVPTANVMDAAAWSAIRLARENSATGTLGGYVMGPPNDTVGPSLWGLPVVLAEAMPANQGVVGDFTAQSITLYERSGGAISTGWIDQQFVRNIVTILAELRAALAVKRPLSFCKISGLP